MGSIASSVLDGLHRPPWAFPHTPTRHFGSPICGQYRVRDGDGFACRPGKRAGPLCHGCTQNCATHAKRGVENEVKVVLGHVRGHYIGLERFWASLGGSPLRYKATSKKNSNQKHAQSGQQTTRGGQMVSCFHIRCGCPCISFFCLRGTRVRNHQNRAMRAM